MGEYKMQIFLQGIRQSWFSRFFRVSNCFRKMGWRYGAGLGLIGTVVFIWVSSAEITQKIFMEYKQPFAITFFGTSLMVVYLPIAFLREWICSMVDKNVLKRLYRGNKNLSSSNDLDTPLRSNDMQRTLQSSARSCSISDADLSAREEGKPLITNHSEDGSQQNFELSSWEIAKFSLCLAPIWFLNEVLVFCMTYCMLL